MRVCTRGIVRQPSYVSQEEEQICELPSRGRWCGLRIVVNNLAGVPAIVFGMFSLGLFVYLIGGSLGRIFYPEALPRPPSVFGRA